MSPFRRIAPLLPAVLLPAALLMVPSAAHAAGGMPQLDFGNPLLLSQVVWGTIIFIVLYILLSRFALPKVGSVLEERAAHIARDLESARAAKTKADSGIAEATEAVGKARADAQSAINAALDEAKAAATAQAEVLNARLERQLHDAEAQIAQARASAMGALRQVASETADTVVTRLTGTAPDRSRLGNAVGAALGARGLG